MIRSSQPRGSDPAHADTPLPPSSMPSSPPAEYKLSRSQPPAAWVAQALIGPTETVSARVLYVASSERRAEEIGRALRQFAPETEVLVLPAWDCLPFDCASPSPETMGRRMAVLQRLREPQSGRCVIVAPVEALLQRIPPASAFARAFMEVSVGERLDRGALEAFARATGYAAADRVDEPGEINILGEVVDIYPAGADAPVRVRIGSRRMK